MKLYQRKRRIQAVSQIAQAPANRYAAMKREQLVEAGRAAGLSPLCTNWRDETIINKLMEIEANG